MNVNMNTNNFMNKAKVASQNAFKNMTSNIQNLMNAQNQTLVTYFLIGSIVIFLFGIIFYIRNEMNKGSKNNTAMKTQLDKIKTTITNINTNDAQFKYNLRDYYIMSSYNSCSNGDFNNGFVDYEALKEVIKKGARVLDFEVYSVDNQTVIAASDNDNYYQKGTYNSIPFSKTMDIINSYAFSASTCPNFNDPLFLHFRIKSEQPHVFDDMTKVLTSVFKQRRLGNKYNYEFGGENIGTEPLSNFLGKVIIMCDRSNKVFMKTKLDEIVNVTSGSHFLQSYRNYNVEYTHNYQDLINNNKKNMGISLPDYNTDTTNMNANIHIKYGIQMICMKFQNIDNNLVYYLDTFNKNGHSFILKPEELRYIQKVIPLPKPQDKGLSFAEKTVSKPYFSHKI
jgi:hypothetical protein